MLLPDLNPQYLTSDMVDTLPQVESETKKQQQQGLLDWGLQKITSIGQGYPTNVTQFGQLLRS